jgi:hypothetical protein
MVLSNLASRETKNAAAVSRCHFCRLSSGSNCAELYRRRGRETHWRDCNHNRQSGRSSSIRERQHFLEYGWKVPKSGVYGFYPRCECGPVQRSSVLRRANGRRLGKNHIVSGEARNHCHISIAVGCQVACGNHHLADPAPSVLKEHRDIWSRGGCFRDWFSTSFSLRYCGYSRSACVWLVWRSLPNQTMKPRTRDLFATNPARGLSLSR